MVGLFLFATLVAPIFVAYFLRRGKLWWLASALVACVGAYLLITVDHTPHHGDDSVVGAWDSIGTFLQLAYGGAMLVYALILGAMTQASNALDQRRAPVELPVAKVL